MKSSAAASVALLLAEIDRYLGEREPAPGVADVRAGLAPALGMAARPLAPRPNAIVAQHLATALDAARAADAALATSIGLAAPELDWITYPYYDPAEIGADFLAGHAYAEIVGPGPASAIAAGDFALGVFLIAPHVLYRDHRHPAPELYAPLTGPHGWRFGPDQPLVLKPAHETVWNPAMAPHMTKVGPVPFLCIYGWTRDVEAPATVIAASDWPEMERMRIAAQ